MSNRTVSGLERFYFIITPEELRNCLADFHLVISTTHVPIDYTESSLDEYVNIQTQLFGKLAKGEKLIWKEHWKLFESMSLTTDLTRCGYDGVHKYQGKLYKSSSFDVPCPHLQAFVFYVAEHDDGEFNIVKTCSESQFPENTVGFELFYPKKVMFNDDEWESTKKLVSYQDFLLLKNRIQAITKPLTFSMKGKKVRPGVQVSEQALLSVPNFYFFKNNPVDEICRKVL